MGLGFWYKGLGLENPYRYRLGNIATSTIGNVPQSMYPGLRHPVFVVIG